MDNYVGKRIDGRYIINEIIGVGGMAVVYKAYDSVEQMTVAIKILKSEFLNDAETCRRFENESRAISSLNHPNIVKIYNVSFGDLIKYIVMEYIDGITLKEYILRRGAVEKLDAIYFVERILKALRHAHDKGIYHRDIKPQNIMLMRDGTIKVTDFGIAKLSNSETKTLTTEAIGSIHYISPERIKGNKIDRQSDIYSVGIVLYELLTGRLPFDGSSTAEVIFKQIRKEPEKPSAVNPDIEKGLEQIVLKAMQKGKASRYISASEMLRDIRLYVKNPAIVFNHITLSERPVARKPAPSPNYISKSRAKEEVIKASKTPEVQRQIQNNKKSTKKILVSLIVVLVLLIAAAGGLFVFFSKNSNTVPVPNVVGLNYSEEIQNNSRYSMFNFEIVDEENDEVEEGNVVSQNPSNGKIKRGGTIVLHIAVDNATKKVPDVYGKEYGEAETLLKSQGFKVTIFRRASSSVEAGKVIRTSPARSEETQPGMTITIYVATGEDVEKVDVPNLIGMTVSEAKIALEEKGLSLDSSRTEYRASTVTRGEIFGYEHVGESVEIGTAIAVYVSSGNIETTVSTTESTTESTTAPSTTESTTKATTAAPSTTESTTKATTAAPSTTESTTKATTAAPSTTESTTKATTAAPSTTASTTKDSAPDDDSPILE